MLHAASWVRLARSRRPHQTRKRDAHCSGFLRRFPASLTRSAACLTPRPVCFHAFPGPAPAAPLSTPGVSGAVPDSALSERTRYEHAQCKSQCQVTHPGYRAGLQSWATEPGYRASYRASYRARSQTQATEVTAPCCGGGVERRQKGASARRSIRRSRRSSYPAVSARTRHPTQSPSCVGCARCTSRRP